MSFQGAWSSVLRQLILPQDAGPDDSAILLVGKDSLPDCMKGDYEAAILWRPPFSVSFNAPYFFIAENANHTSRVDFGFLQYDPTEGLCRYWVTEYRDSGLIGTTLDILHRIGNLDPPVGFDTSYDLELDLGVNGDFQILSGRLIAYDDSILSDTLIDGELVLSAGSQAVGTEDSSDTTQFSTAAGSYTTAGGNVVGTSFRLPMMGRAVISITAQMTNNTANAITFVTYEIREGSVIGSGTVVVAASDNNSIVFSGPANSFCTPSRVHIFNGTPAGQYNIRLLHKVNAGTALIERRALIVQPTFFSHY